jgi:hypothetical protein
MKRCCLRGATMANFFYNTPDNFGEVIVIRENASLLAGPCLTNQSGFGAVQA